ncbi:hypothetical protein BGZ83_008536 [Gryganskiella cystojenkinii]|nr:hypothetical protein BGZ83_008536 [Gryganskiella cystojenkinii]
MTDVHIPEDYLPIVDGLLWKKILKEGSGESPVARSSVNVHYVGTIFTTGDKFDSSRDRSSPFTFKLGVGQVIKGWDEGVITMKIGELAELVCAPEYGYGAGGSPPKIPGNSYLKFEVELLSFQESADSPKAKLDLAAKKKDLGNAAFKQGDNAAAARAYEEGANLLRDMRDGTDEQKDVATPLRIALLSNQAAACLKLNDHAEALDACLAALDIQEGNVKVIYRMAQAYLGLQEFDDAKKTAQKGLDLAPNDATFTSLLTVISSKRAAYIKKEKATYSKMFS